MQKNDHEIFHCLTLTGNRRVILQVEAGVRGLLQTQKLDNDMG